MRWLANPPPGKTFEQIWRELEEAAELFSAFWNAGIERICIENPVMYKIRQSAHSELPGVSQSAQPWQFGHGETKRTCFWLKNLPLLNPTDIVDGREQRIFRLPPGPDRWKERSRFFPGIAKAMAEQWG